MTPESTEADLITSKTELFFSALSGSAVEAQCITCCAVEWVIPLDLPIDETFIANYFCDECEAVPTAEGQSP